MQCGIAAQGRAAAHYAGIAAVGSGGMTHIGERAAELSDVTWFIAIAGHEERVEVKAAAIENFGVGGTIHSVNGGAALTALLNAAGEVVFQAPSLSIAYLVREQP
jgi:hypothetical protein